MAIVAIFYLEKFYEERNLLESVPNQAKVDEKKRKKHS